MIQPEPKFKVRDIVKINFPELECHEYRARVIRVAWCVFEWGYRVNIHCYANDVLIMERFLQ